MASTEEVTALLHKIDSGILVLATYNNSDEQSINEALQMGLIYKSINIYLLTKEGLLIVRSNKTYDDYLRERFPPQNPKAVESPPHKTNSHAGTQLLKKSWKMFIMILNNDWVKFSIIAIGSGLIIWYITVEHPWSHLKAIKKAPIGNKAP